jgi:hypothetical protein
MNKLEKPQTVEIKPTENRRKKTSFNLLQKNIENFSRCATARGITQTEAMDEAMTNWIAEMTNTSDIEQMIAKTNGFIFERNLDTVKAMLESKIAKFGAFKTAYLYGRLKDKDDRSRVFAVLGLGDALKQIDEMNRILEKSSIFKGSEFTGYNEFTVSNELKAILTPLQAEYLKDKLGVEAFNKLKVQRPSVFSNETAEDLAAVEESVTDNSEVGFSK